ncbi:MAG: SDR family NAD(P)-dependent oxidoreductase [Burkholderiaceae bacterium]|nr:SDR family NAD(P)-dependent oxidoreductase [Burkholderiaceae bacterium]
MRTDTPTAGVQRRGARLGRPRLLIVGCGKVGLEIVARLHRRFRIFATTTSREHFAQLRMAGAVPVVLNLDGRRERPIAGLAARAICLAPPATEPYADRRIAQLLRSLRRPPSCLVYVSTTGVYGDRRGGKVDETSRPAPMTERARRRLASELRARAHPWHAAVLRVPGIYGPERLPLERLRSATPAPLPADDVLTNHIHVEDLANICIAALFRSDPRRIYNAVDDSHLHLGEYLDLVADRFALPRPPRLAHEALRAAVTPMQFSFFRESRRLSNRRIKQELRVRLHYPTARDGVDSIAAAATFQSR